MKITELRANIYKIMDNILTTGQPVDIERGEKYLRIIPVERQTQPEGKLNKLIARPEVIVGPPEYFTHIDWSHEWKP